MLGEPFHLKCNIKFFKSKQCCTVSTDLLLQFFLRVSKGAASSARAASLLLHITTHVCLVLAVLRWLKKTSSNTYEKKYIFT